MQSMTAWAFIKTDCREAHTQCVTHWLVHYLQLMAWGDLSVTEYGQHSEDSGGDTGVLGPVEKMV